MPQVRVGIVGDLDPESSTHVATTEAVNHGSAAGEVACEWVPTTEVFSTDLDAFHGVWLAPGSPYDSIDGALEAVRVARERGIPFLGTCAGFQHAALEFARSVVGIQEAGHAEYGAGSRLVITPLSCSLAGQNREVTFVVGSRVHSAYGRLSSVEPYRCSFGLDGGARVELERAGLRMSGIDDDGEVRVVELAEHPFFIAALYVPQLASTPADPHPLIRSFVEACRDRRPGALFRHR